MENAILFVKIATERTPHAEEYLPYLRPPANYKNPEKIAEWFAEKQAAQLDGAALDPDLGRIRAIGIRLQPSGTTQVAIAGRHGGEVDLLRWFWRLAYLAKGNFCGYNLLGFDMPFLLRRSMFLREQPSISIDLRRYQTAPLTDLFAILYGWQPGRSLDFVSNHYLAGDPEPVEARGSNEGLPEDKLESSLALDLERVVGLFRQMNGFYWPARTFPVLEEGRDVFTLTPDFWDCECEHNFWHYSFDPRCVACGMERDDQPDSRIPELLDPPHPW